MGRESNPQSETEPCDSWIVHRVVSTDRLVTKGDAALTPDQLQINLHNQLWAKVRAIHPAGWNSPAEFSVTPLDRWIAFLSAHVLALLGLLLR